MYLPEFESRGIELVILTPHFTHPDLMGSQDLRMTDERPFVLFLRDFATENQIALADASARWEFMWQ